MFLHAHTNGIKELSIQYLLFTLRINQKIGLFGYQAMLDIHKNCVCDLSEVHSCTETNI